MSGRHPFCGNAAYDNHTDNGQYGDGDNLLHDNEALPDYLERTRPASLREEIRRQVCNLLDAILDVRSTVFIGIGLIGPIDDQTLSDDQFARDESPITAVGAVIAIVPHRKIVARWHNDFAILGVIFVPIRILVDASVDPPRMRLRREEIPKWIGV